MSTAKKYLISFDSANILKGVTYCLIEREARKRTYVKIENAGDYAGIQGSPAGEGFYVNPENILKSGASFDDFNAARKTFKGLVENLNELLASTEEKHKEIDADYKEQRAALIEAFKASLMPAPEPATAPAPTEPAAAEGVAA